jgi:hypothetical protein
VRRTKLLKSVTALAALATGAGLAGAGTAAIAATGTELKLSATDDTYASSGRKDATFGAEEKLSVGRLDRDTKIGFLRFEVPAGTGVSGARLRLTTIGEVTGTFTLSSLASTAWSQSTLTSQNAPQLSKIASTLTPAADATELVFDLSSTITGPGTYAFGLQSSATSAVTRFRSSEGKSGAPQLLVTTSAPATTAPSTVVPPAVDDEDMPPPGGQNVPSAGQNVPSTPTAPATTVPATPSTPGGQNVPSTPTAPATTVPATPSTPGGQNVPSTPTAPATTVPATPSTPGGQNVPSTPTAPATTVPATPSTPGGQNVPSTPTAPATTTPTTPTTPGGQNVPSAGQNVPSAPSAPVTTTPSTPATGTPTTGTPGTGAAKECVTGALLVPSCGVLWGAAAGGFTDAPRDQAIKDWEKLSGRPATIFHAYHKGDEPFPLKWEIEMASDEKNPRIPLLNWKIAEGSTWRKVAAGEQDARIDRFAARAKTFPGRFYLVLNHEPENDVKLKGDKGYEAGWEAKDFAAMYRHTIERLRAKGVTNVVNVLAYMGNEKWMSQSWWKDFYPGDDVVDWIGLDSYVNTKEKDYHYGMFADLLDRAGTYAPDGFYKWATTQHPSKPIMVAEWGAYHSIKGSGDKAAVYRSVLPELAKRPAVKAIVYFDTKNDDTGDRDISIDSSAASLAAFRTLAASPLFKVTVK